MKHKSYMISVIGLLAGILFSQHALGDSRFVKLEKIFIPSGFDDNDNIEVFVYGQLPNLCFHAPKVKAERPKVKEKKPYLGKTPV